MEEEISIRQVWTNKYQTKRENIKKKKRKKRHLNYFTILTQRKKNRLVNLKIIINGVVLKSHAHTKEKLPHRIILQLMKKMGKATKT